MKKIAITESLYLKEVALDDASDLFYIMDSERDSLREFLPFIDYTQQLSDTEEFIRSVEEGGASKLDTVFVVKYEEKTAGLIGYKDTDALNKRTEIGYWLSERFRGKGLVTQACKALIQHAFTEMAIHRVQLKVAVNNHKSIAVAKRLGFTQEGRERDGELLASGFTDLYVYGILKSEWINI